MIFEAVYSNGKVIRGYYSLEFDYYVAWEMFIDRVLIYGKGNGVKLITICCSTPFYENEKGIK